MSIKIQNKIKIYNKHKETRKNKINTIMSNLPSNMNELEEGEISNDNISSPEKNKNVINQIIYQKCC